ncbi:MAG: hypothetical protein R3345_09720 [Fulvivirga sp.]|nr:hypothetical protein [Fulvivirga sp.]
MGFNIGNRWSIYKTPSYNLSLGINWLNLSFSPTELDLLDAYLYSDWIFTAGLMKPEVTNTFILHNNGALEQQISGGYMNHLGEETSGFMIKSGIKYRYKKIGVGANYTFGKTRDGTYGFPITLHILNFTVGLKF